MTLARKPGSYEDTIHAAKLECGGWPEMAAMLRRPGDADKLRKTPYAEPDVAKGAHFRYSDAQALTDQGVMAFAQDLAARCGCALVPIQASSADITKVIEKSARLMAEAGEAVSTIGAAVADGEITPAERSDMRRQLLDVKRATAEALAAIGGEG